VRMELPPGTGGDPEGMPWHETKALAKLTPQQWDLLGGHVWCQAVSAGLAAVLVTAGFGASDRLRQKLQIPLMAGLLFAAVAMGWGAYYGGEMVYRHGTAVNVVQEKGAMPESSAPATTESAAKEQTEVKRGLERAIPPLQLHVTLAGLAAALAFAALGMSLRALSTADQWRDPEVSHAHNLIDLEAGPRNGDAYARSSPDADAGHGPHHIPSARFWLLTSGVALLAALAGYWFLAGPDELGTWKPQRLWEAIVGKRRRLYHVVTGVSLVVLPLLLALAARFARRSKLLLGILSLVAVVALAAQAWLGVLLMFDTPNGKVTGFNKKEAPIVTAMK
jgi:hypothetical protein